ncbi:hypothetical protein L917_01407 [Phytophthora nicotianae]|uniref:Uncharacterized protein n=1 Tax=Phytophthora nicotianae TaxID=4792 RepID=W2LX31_PHYNI|nr:hypothetical protein L917_01407 [Phytophthora nicotianae]
MQDRPSTAPLMLSTDNLGVSENSSAESSETESAITVDGGLEDEKAVIASRGSSSFEDSVN